MSIIDVARTPLLDVDEAAREAERLEPASAEDVLAWAADRFPGASS